MGEYGRYYLEHPRYGFTEAQLKRTAAILRALYNREPHEYLRKAEQFVEQLADQVPLPRTRKQRTAGWCRQLVQKVEARIASGEKVTAAFRSIAEEEGDLSHKSVGRIYYDTRKRHEPRSRSRRRKSGDAAAS